jgi:hypothetical protein
MPSSGLTPEQEQKAREALRKAIDEANARETPPPAVETAPPKLIMQPPVEKPAKPVPAPVVVAPATPPPAAPPAVATTSTAPAAAPATPPMTKPAVNTTPAPAPATPAAAAMPSAAETQEARLAELLVLYKADQITPAEYQARRAKILAGQ